MVLLVNVFVEIQFNASFMYKSFNFSKTKFCLAPTFYWCILIFLFCVIYLFSWLSTIMLFWLVFYLIFHGWAPWFCTFVKLAPHKKKWSPQLCHLFVLRLCWFVLQKQTFVLVWFLLTTQTGTNEQHQFREIWTALGGEWRHFPGLCLLFLKRGNIYDVHFNGTNKWHQFCAI